jgi:hypothetical protein
MNILSSFFSSKPSSAPPPSGVNLCIIEPNGTVFYEHVQETSPEAIENAIHAKIGGDQKSWTVHHKGKNDDGLLYWHDLGNIDHTAFNAKASSKLIESKKVYGTCVVIAHNGTEYASVPAHIDFQTEEEEKELPLPTPAKKRVSVVESTPRRSTRRKK